MCCTLNVRQDGQVKDVTIQGHEAHLFLIASMASGDKIFIPQSYKCRMRRLGACSACVQADTKVTSCVMFSKAYVILYSPLIEPRLSDTSCRCPKTSGWRTRTLCDNSNTSCRQLDICNKMSHTLCRKLHSAQEYWDVSSEKCRIPDMTSLSISSTRKIRETDFNFSCDLCTLVLAFIVLKPRPYVIYLKISLNHCILSQIERCFPLIHLCQPTNALYKPILTRTPRLMDECKKTTSHQLTNNVHQFEHASLGMQNSCMSSALTQRTSTMAPRVAAHHQHSATCPCTNNTLQAKGLSNKHNAVDARALTSLEKCNKELKHCRKARKRNSQLSIVPNTTSPPRAQLFSPLQFVIILCSIISVGFTAVSSQRVIGTIPRCDTEGKVIVVPGITNDQCTCKCMNNEVVCDPDKCRRPTKPPKQPSSCDSQLCRDVEGCRVIPFPIGPCCKVCKGCRYRRRQYESDDTWRDPRDPCKQLSCKAGVVTVSKVQCFTHCHNALTIPGQCCPVCQGCFFRGKLYNESETFHLPTDVCTTCTCKNGNLQCERQQCPVLNCKSEYIYQPKSECCHKCRGSREIFVPTKGCFFKDYVYEENEKFSPEPCTQCVCRKKGTAICDKLICPPLDCPVEEQVPMNNTDCCKQCKEKRDCLFEGNGYKHKEEWRPNVCTRCSCVDGVTYCQREKCTNSLWCPQGYRLLLTERECCPRCIEHDAVCSVFGDPHYRTFDGLMYSFQGTCKYILAHDCVSNSFLVKVKNAVRFSSGYAWTQMLVVFLFNHRVSMLQNSVVKVDKVRARLPFVSPGKFSIFKEGSLVKMKSTIGVEVTWDGDSFLEVTVSTKYKQRMCGLCGNYNGIKTDDLLGKDGTMYMSGQQFGHTWRVGSKSACHIESDKLVKAPCEMNSTARLRAQQDCKIFYSHPFAKCRAKVDVNVYVSSCITDMCDCPHGRNCACEAILAYVSQCTRAGLDVKWYKPSSCLDR